MRSERRRFSCETGRSRSANTFIQEQATCESRFSSAMPLGRSTVCVVHLSIKSSPRVLAHAVVSFDARCMHVCARMDFHEVRRVPVRVSRHTHMKRVGVDPVRVHVVQAQGHAVVGVVAMHVAEKTVGREGRGHAHRVGSSHGCRSHVTNLGRAC
jgi:hypothetical protein